MRKVVLAVLVGLLAGCQTGPAVQHDVHTGNTIVRSSRVQARGGLLSSLHATAVHSSKFGYGIYVEYMNTGLGWMFIDQAWSFGKQYTYDVGGRDTLGCYNGCTIRETGAIRMDEQQFRNAASSGFTFKLIGSKGSIEGTVPASVFQQVLQQKSTI